jgi:cell division septation protein DedD
MEETLKARLIGAVVLVALAVLLIPELLSGRKPAGPAVDEGAGPRGTRSFTIELGQPAGPGARSVVTPAAPAPAAIEPDAAPVAAAGDAGAKPPAKPPAELPAEPPAELPATPTGVATVPAAAQRTESPPPASSTAGGGWAVQVGAFGSAETARKLTQDLGGAGYRAFVSPVSRAGKTLYRVRVGPVADRAGAEQLVPRLKARGLPTTVVQND